MRKLLFTALIVLTTLSAFGQGGVPLKTGKKYVIATVEQGTGWVQIKEYPGDNTNAVYSYRNKSYVSWKLHDHIFTNNDVGLPFPTPANTHIMNDGVLTKVGDTIRCVWYNKNGVDLIQEVYPKQFEKSEQIVFRWKVKSYRSDTLNCAVQYLLDLQVGDQNSANDGPALVTSSGYVDDWRIYSDSSTIKVPSFIQTLQYDLPNSPTFDPGITGLIQLDSTNGRQLGLQKPDSVTLGVWPELIQKQWGLPNPVPIHVAYHDRAMLFSWADKIIVKDNTSELGSMSYGPSDIPVCKGSAHTLSFYPSTRHYVAKPKPESFEITTHFYNTNLFPLNDVVASLRVGKHLKITSPAQPLDSGRVQIQSVSNGGVIPAYGTSYAKWIVKIDTSRFPKDDFISSLQINLQSSTTDVILIPNDTCEQGIFFDLPDYDSLPPLFTALPAIDSSTRRVSFSEIRTLDSGLKSIAWTVTPPDDSTNLVITSQFIAGGCMKGIDTITILQKDTTRGVCIHFVAIDCAGNRSESTYCIEGKVFVPPDTLPPVIFDRVNVNKYHKEFKVVDNRPDDSGLSEILVMNFSLDTIRVSTNGSGSKDTVQVKVWLVDSLMPGCAYFRITDMAGNVTLDTTCFVADTTLGVKDTRGDNNFSILGNPSSGRATIQLTLERAQDVTLRIVDALGREVRRLEVKGLSQGENLIPLQTSELASGTYYVLLEFGNRQLTRSLKVIR
jgi:hypothetical protein